MSNLMLVSAVSVLCLAAAAWAAEALPVGGAPAPVEFPWFPDRMHALIWRNWPVVPAERLAKVLGTAPKNVRAVAASMGLGDQKPIAPEWKTRGYITVLRRNWHLLGYDQLLVLLDMSADKLAYCLREDDFLFHKLGRLKPKCPPLRYRPPGDAAKKRAAEIKRIVTETFPEGVLGGEPRFAFVQRLSKPRPGGGRRPAGGGRLSPRYIYSYFALYGDPLMNPRLDPYPEGLLQRLAEVGVDGVWMHVVLRTLAPGKAFPEFGRGCETRLANLRKFVERARKYGIGIYLYMNEPRAMPASFFKGREGLRGVREGSHYAMCTSTPQVRGWIRDSLAHVFRNVPHLAGVFTITASENFTSCASHHRNRGCPRCKKRKPAAIIAEVNATIEAGVHGGNPKARVIVWDWGWRDQWAGDAIAALPKSCWFMSVSEWSKPIVRGGIKTAVGEYSLSAVGPGPRATRHWKLARQAGLKTVAKVQLNNTWELSAVPYLPVLDLVAEHTENLAKAGVSGMMLSWTLGGYPSPNLEVAEQFNRKTLPTRGAALDAVARARFGAKGAAHARRAWTAFSNAFREFPFHIGVLYRGPMQYGPSNPLYPQPTGYGSTMIGFPYDHLDGWRGPYPADVFAKQFEKVAAGWQAGLAELAEAVKAAPPARLADARAELGFARAAWLHFRSCANQTRFVVARNALRAGDKPLPAARRKALAEQIRAIARDEIEIARSLFTLARHDSRIAYEASNHYYYLPVDLVEKVLNCRYLLEEEEEEGEEEGKPQRPRRARRARRSG